MQIEELTANELGTLASEFPEGLCFDDFFSDRNVVQDALVVMLRELQPAFGYCLQFREQPDDGSYFEPYDNSGLLLNWFNWKLPASLPGTRVPYRRLVNADTWPHHWPVVAELKPNGTLPMFVPVASWRAQIRLRANIDGERKHVGYFKAVVPDGAPPIERCRLVDAYRETCHELGRQLARRRAKLAHWDKTLSHLQPTQDCTDGLLVANRLNEALEQLAIAITSHLGAPVDRAAFFIKTRNDDAAVCVWAHGGDGSPEWARTVQEPVSAVPSLARLHELGNVRANDRFYCDMVGNSPARVAVSQSPSLLARLFKNSGSLAAIDSSRVLFDEPPDTYDLAEGKVKWSIGRRIAARCDENDSWIREVQECQPDSSLLKCRNRQWFLIPWLNDQKLLGVWLFDFAPWSRALDHEIAPRLDRASAILARFASRFSTRVFSQIDASPA